MSKTNGKIATRGEAAAKAYAQLIDALITWEEAEELTPAEKKEVVRRVKELDMTRADAEAEVREEREDAQKDADKEENEERTNLAVLRHRSYLPFVRAGLMTVAEAVREVGANRSADGLGQERE
jgi:hypothetical protein